MTGGIERPPPHDVALPKSFAARYGEGARRGLCLGGGGLFFIAWQAAYLSALVSEGIDIGAADKVVGTSAGSFVGSALTGGRLRRVYAEVRILSNVSAVLPDLSSNAKLRPSQQHALDLFFQASDADVETVRAIGHAALAARTSSARVIRSGVGMMIGTRRWPSPALHITCVDAYTGERCVVTRDANVPVANAVAASCAIPGASPPQPVGDRRCIDGGVGGSGMHLDILAGAGRALVLALSDGSDVTVGMATNAPGSSKREFADLEASGTEVLLRTPESFDVDELMSPASVPKALAMGARQAAADAAELLAFWK
jgi:NTE family protein